MELFTAFVILLVNIILVPVLVVLVRQQNSASGHAQRGKWRFL